MIARIEQLALRDNTHIEIDVTPTMQIYVADNMPHAVIAFNNHIARSIVNVVSNGNKWCVIFNAANGIWCGA